MIWLPASPHNQPYCCLLHRRFLLRIEQGYPSNPYHSRVHAADVLRMYHVVLTRGGVLPALMASVRGRASAHSPEDGKVVPQHDHGAASDGSGQVSRRSLLLSLITH